MPPVTEMALVVGPMEPATQRGRSGVLKRSSSLSSQLGGDAVDLVGAGRRGRTRPSTSGVPPKVSVSVMSAPAAKYASWMPSNELRAGKHQVLVAALRTGRPPKSAAFRFRS